MAIKFECEDPEDEWHDHGACIDQQLLVNAYYSEVMSLNNKINLLVMFYSKLIYWNNIVSESFMNTELGYTFENMRIEAEGNRKMLAELLYRDMPKVIAEEYEKARNECYIHKTNFADHCQRCQHVVSWKKKKFETENSPLPTVRPAHIEP